MVWDEIGMGESKGRGGGVYALSYLPFDSKRLPPIDLDVRIVEALSRWARMLHRELRRSRLWRVDPIMSRDAMRKGNEGAKCRASTTALPAASREGRSKAEGGATDDGEKSEDVRRTRRLLRRWPRRLGPKCALASWARRLCAARR